MADTAREISQDLGKLEGYTDEEKEDFIKLLV